jgi:GMP synthase (glutamine-hydrolysing)
VSEARLRTALWVQACVRQGSVAGIPVVVVHKGDETSGAVLVKLNGFAKGCTVLVETRDQTGARAWLRGTGASPVTEQEADAYIERNRRRDPDLWIVEVEDRGGALPFDGAILTA